VTTVALTIPVCWFCGRAFPGRINNLRQHQRKAHGWSPPPDVCRIGECGKPALNDALCSMHKSRVERYGDPHYDPDSPEARFWRYLPETRGDGCWGWTGARSGDGYGAIKVAGSMIHASRLAYAIHHPDEDISGVWRPDPALVAACGVTA
jgi:hypothetical protein